MMTLIIPRVYSDARQNRGHEKRGLTGLARQTPFSRELEVFALADFSIADLLINRIGCRIQKIREEVAEFLSRFQTAIR
jgi:hypothetical protein